MLFCRRCITKTLFISAKSPARLATHWIRFSVSAARAASSHPPRSTFLLATLLLVAVPGRPTVTLKVSTASGGVTISGSSPSFSSGYGNVNGLGVGTPTAGLSVLTSGVTGGVLYTTPYNIVLSGLSGDKAKVTVYVSAQFTHSTTFYLMSCYPSSGCTAAGSYTSIVTTPATPTTIIASPGVANGTYVASLALFVSNADGSGVYTGTDTATLTFVATNISTSKTSTVTLALNTPSENVQTALQLLLSTYTGGLTITAGSGNPDFSTSFGNVNGLGVGPGTGLTVVSASGGNIYSTPYYIEPSFSSFTSTTCSVSTYVSSNFQYYGVLALEDSSSGTSGFSKISTASGSPTSITTTCSSGTNITRYLGLFVSSTNASGAGYGAGSDNATLTYTMTVP